MRVKSECKSKDKKKRTQSARSAQSAQSARSAVCSLQSAWSAFWGDPINQDDRWNLSNIVHFQHASTERRELAWVLSLHSL